MKKSFARAIGFVMAAVTLFNTCSFAAADAPAVEETTEKAAEEIKEQAVTPDVPYKTVELDENDPNYYKELLAAEYYNYKYIRSYPTLYENEGWASYQGKANILGQINADELTDSDKEKIKAAKEAREALVQLIPFEKEVYYIWGDYAPVIQEEHKWDDSKWDNEDFRPFLVPYLVEDQSKAKGTLLIVSGGGNQTRSNQVEGYMVCPAFVEQGYNCFLLQRRVDPYNGDETGLDLQRSIRWIRAHAEEFGLGGMDVIGAAGFSGGGGNVRTLISKYYGDITPDKFDPNYKPDEIDAINSDIDVAMIIYSGRALETENPKLPHIFIAVGEDDSFDGSIELFQQVKKIRNVNPELHIYGQNGHGFGAGLLGTSSMLWIPSADMYMQKVMGKAESKFDGEIPAEYTKTQTVTYGGFPIGETKVDVYLNDANTMIYVAFFAWGTEQIVEGMLQGDGVIVTYDKEGYLGRNGDVPKIYAICDPEAWVPVER
ncbi:MAG: hypothetical protein IJ773_10395 [Lachnospiraceae bacterium]|nr:hypothetical protein [Lachnospiraceae bacterium]